MVNVKLSIAFVIAAAAVAPIFAQPIALDGEMLETREPHRGNRGQGPRRQYHHHEPSGADSAPTPTPADSPSGSSHWHSQGPPADVAPQPHPREFVNEEFEARALGLGDEKMFASLLEDILKDRTMHSPALATASGKRTVPSRRQTTD